MPTGIPHVASIDFSRAKSLKQVAFWLGALDDVWITLALKTLTPNHRDLHQISIYIPVNRFLKTRLAMEEIHRQWADLDHFLVQLWESNAIHTRVIYRLKGEKEARECVRGLLPEMTKRGTVELVDQRLRSNDSWE